LKAIALVDCNNFYVSCQRVFEPKLSGRPVVVLSNNDGNVIARSNEAKAFVEMGSPLFKIKDLIKEHGIHVFSSNYALYGDMSARVKEVLARFSPKAENYSIDESFLDLSGFEHKDLDSYGREIKETVEQWTGIPVSVGIGETKSLAKISNKIAKRSAKASGVLNLVGSPYLDKALSQVDVGDVWGIGEAYETLLKQSGMPTALDLKHAPEHWVKTKLTVVGQRIVRELNGEQCIPLELIPPDKKMIGSAKGFGVLIEDMETMQEAIANFTTRSAEKVRAQKMAVKTMTVWVSTDTFRNEPQYQNAVDIELPVATDHTPTLVRFARAAISKIYKKSYRYKRVGILFNELIPADQVQGNLFWETPRNDDKVLMRVVDQLNGQFGRGTIRFLAQGVSDHWKTKFQFKSPSYTTRWSDIPIARVV
jgi:DNA polymerase V